MTIFEIINVITAVVTIASAIAAMTPTPKDDAFIAKYITPIVDALALNIGHAKR